jgi:hypothetical protein
VGVLPPILDHSRSHQAARPVPPRARPGDRRRADHRDRLDPPQDRAQFRIGIRDRFESAHRLSLTKLPAVIFTPRPSVLSTRVGCMIRSATEWRRERPHCLLFASTKSGMWRLLIAAPTAVNKPMHQQLYHLAACFLIAGAAFGERLKINPRLRQAVVQACQCITAGLLVSGKAQ